LHHDVQQSRANSSLSLHSRSHSPQHEAATHHHTIEHASAPQSSFDAASWAAINAQEDEQIAIWAAEMKKLQNEIQANKLSKKNKKSNQQQEMEVEILFDNDNDNESNNNNPNAEVFSVQHSATEYHHRSDINSHEYEFDDSDLVHDEKHSEAHDANRQTTINNKQQQSHSTSTHSHSHTDADADSSSSSHARPRANKATKSSTKHRHFDNSHSTRKKEKQSQLD
jgi:hypothetical protein